MRATEILEAFAVVATNAALRAEPERALSIFEYTFNAITQQAILRGEGLESLSVVATDSSSRFR